MRSYINVLAFGQVMFCAALAAQNAAPIPMITPPPQAGPDQRAEMTLPVPYQVLPDNRVTFRLKAAPEATSVKVVGEWPGGLGGRSTIPMVKGDQGIWSATVGPLQSDVWSYSFSVDGATVLPSFGGMENTPILPVTDFVIPGPYGSDFAPHGAPRGSVTYVHVPFMGATKDIEVFLPAGYFENPTKRYPVLYLTMGGAGLPGNGGGENPEFVMLENMIASGRAVPMIAVTFSPTAPGGDSDGWSPFAGGGNRTNERYVMSAQAISDEVVPWIDRAFRTIADRDHRAIGGFSSAGAQGFLAGAKNPEKFANIFTFSGGYATWPGVGIQIQSKLDPKNFSGPDFNRVADMQKLGAMIPKLNGSANMKLVALYCGTSEPLIQTHELLKKFLDERGVKYIATENPGYTHEGRNVRVSLHDLVTKIFK